jgi:16S rRNA (adenine1518-N6/adenine1519-N6)-dimethyltransferase
LLKENENGMDKIKPLKRFGQNYLVDRNTINKIVDEFNPQPDDIVIEIGPGQGALTSLLQDKVKKLYAVEIDRRVIDELNYKFPSVEFINDDFLKMNLASISSGKKTRIIGNIPYYITSPIIFKLIEERETLIDTMIMTQFEVAQRIVAKPRTKEYGILSVILNFFAETNLCFKISPNVFFPKPNVDSAILHFQFNKELPKDVDYKLFIKVVKASFGNRRKTLKNSLSNSGFSEVNFALLDFDFTRRAEELTIADFILLTNIIERETGNPVV